MSSGTVKARSARKPSQERLDRWCGNGSSPADDLFDPVSGPSRQENVTLLQHEGNLKSIGRPPGRSLAAPPPTVRDPGTRMRGRLAWRDAPPLAHAGPDVDRPVCPAAGRLPDRRGTAG